MALELLVPVAAVSVGYWVATKTREEVAQGKRFLLALTIALTIVVAVLLAFGTGAYAPGGLASVELLTVFGVLLGTLLYARSQGIIGALPRGKRASTAR